MICDDNSQEENIIKTIYHCANCDLELIESYDDVMKNYNCPSCNHRMMFLGRTYEDTDCIIATYRCDFCNIEIADQNYT